MKDGWDAIVCGAGPAGASAALPLARAGWRVLMVERRRQVGIPVQCAEYVPARLAAEMDAPAAARAQHVGSLHTFIGGKLAAGNAWPGVMLHRSIFDQHLAARAMDAGATLWTGCRVEALGDGSVWVRREGCVSKLAAGAIIGADGPVSVTARAVGCAPSEFVYGLQVEAPLAAAMDHTEAHFQPEFPGGYGWVFPKGEFANVGLAVARPAAGLLPGLLDAFLAGLRARGVVATGPTKRKTGGLIPVGGPPERTVWGRLLLAGDAAGQTDPITGSGIPAAVQCGRMAGEAACEALAAGDPARASGYEEEWRDLLARPLMRALERRRTQCAEWGQGQFERLIRRTWIAFPEYYDAR